MKHLMKYASLFIFLAIVVSCNDDEMTNPTVSMNFKTNTSDFGVRAQANQANTLQFTSGTIVLREIEFEAETEEGDSIEVNIEQIVEVDYATGATSPDISNLVFPMGTYVEARVELELQDENSDPSVVVEGTFTDADEVAHPIRFEFNSGETFEVEKEGNVVFGESAMIIAEITFDAEAWFAGVTIGQLTAATKNSDGVIVISETSNPDIFDIVADGLDLATELEIEL